eukprot:Phypoly_transcript_22790.p1 GENE.Phypoly_transcript_22790~~Phypoly_transcript_22790.p1  ORF type:complete len:111 (-),score=20.90 Phypoly_transcript_22790:156-488(-)
MSDFHNAIAQQIATLANITTEQALQCIEEPKNLAKADLAVVIAKINKFCKLSGNPAQIANEWKGKVRNVKHNFHGERNLLKEKNEQKFNPKEREGKKCEENFWKGSSLSW